MSRRGRQREQHEEGGDERWLVSYADFITLLFAFFVVLYATSEKNFGRAEEFQESLKTYLVKAGGVPGAGGGAQAPHEHERLDSAIENPLPTFSRGTPVSREVQREIEDYVETQLISDELEQAILDIRLDDYGVRFSLSSQFIFEQESEQFRSSALKVLGQMGLLLKRLDRKIIVESHTSSWPLATSRYPSHWELASARATTFIRYLANVQGLEPSDLMAVSYGAQRPLVPEDSDVDRRRNDRLDLLILTETSPL